MQPAVAARLPKVRRPAISRGEVRVGVRRVVIRVVTELSWRPDTCRMLLLLLLVVVAETRTAVDPVRDGSLASMWCDIVVVSGVGPAPAAHSARVMSVLRGGVGTRRGTVVSVSAIAAVLLRAMLLLLLMEFRTTHGRSDAVMRCRGHRGRTCVV